MRLWNGLFSIEVQQVNNKSRENIGKSALAAHAGSPTYVITSPVNPQSLEFRD
jgi:hypothetical protein